MHLINREEEMPWLIDSHLQRIQLLLGAEDPPDFPMGNVVQ